MTEILMARKDELDAHIASSNPHTGAQPLDALLTAIAALTTAADQLIYTTGADTVALTALTAFARTLLDDADATAARTTLGAEASGTAAAAVAAHEAAGDPHPQYLTAAEGDAVYQPLDAELTALAGLTSAADKGIQFTGAGTAGTYDLTAAGKALLDDADAAAQRATLGLGTAATKNTGTSGAKVPLLDGANTWSATQTIQSTDAGAAAGPFLDIDRASASPAINDLLGVLRFRGRSSTGTNREYAGVLAVIKDPTDAAEDAELFLRTTVAGSGADRVRIGAGLYTSAATGGDKGADSINAGAYYENGVRMDAQGMAKAWVSFNGTGTVAINDSFNVTSVTDNGTGNYTVNLTTAFANTSYAVSGSPKKNNNADASVLTRWTSDLKTTSAVQIRIWNTGGPSLDDSPDVSVTFFGDQ